MTITKTAIVAGESLDVRYAQCEVLMSMGFLPIQAADGFQLLERLRKVRPSLIVMEMALHGLDGSEVLHFIRRNEDWMDVPVLVWSDAIDEAAKKVILRQGATAVLARPPDIGVLRAAVAELLLKDPPRDQGSILPLL